MFYTEAGLTKLGQIIRKARGKMSLRDFADQIGLSHATIDRLEKAEFKNPQNNKLAAISKHIGFTLEEMIAIARGNQEPSLCRKTVESQVLQLVNELSATEVERLIKALQQDLEASR